MEPKGSLRILSLAFRRTLPVMSGYIPLGVAFGFLLTKSGYPWFFAVFMSTIMYAGAAQFLSIGFFVNNAAMLEIALATLFLNLRHSFFGLSLIRKFSETGLLKPYLIFALTDETYALITTIEAPEETSRSRYYFFVSLLDHLYWVSGTFLGALIGSAVTMNLKGLDFALTALFVVLTIEQYRKIRTFRPFAVALAVGTASMILVTPQYMLLASIAGGVTILLLTRKAGRKP